MAKRQRNPYLELFKPGIVVMQLVTFAFGFVLGIDDVLQPNLILLGYGTLGTLCIAAGSVVFNNYLEREIDRKMERTKDRVLPSGRLSPHWAFIIGITLILVGQYILFTKINNLTAFLGIITIFLYVLVYTPLKRVSWINTYVGAFPGAIPPLGGWAAATGTLSINAWLLFAILFLWQLPHFFALAWMYKDDYANAGFQMLSNEDPDGKRTKMHMLLNLGALLVIAPSLAATGLMGLPYAVGAIVLTVWFLQKGVVYSKSRALSDARAVFLVSIAYLPTLLALMIVDRLIQLW